MAERGQSVDDLAGEGAGDVQASETMRSALEEELRGMAKGFGDRVLVDGVEFKRHEPGLGKYFCLGGTLLVQRDTYRRVGVHNGPTVRNRARRRRPPNERAGDESRENAGPRSPSS